MGQFEMDFAEKRAGVISSFALHHQPTLDLDHVSTHDFRATSLYHPSPLTSYNTAIGFCITILHEGNYHERVNSNHCGLFVAAVET